MPRWIYVVIATGLLILGGLLAAILLAGSEIRERQEATCESIVDPGRWRHEPVNPGLRLRIAVQAADCGTLDEESRAEIRRSLGPPHQVSKDRRGWTYQSVGRTSDFTLKLHFDESGRVDRVTWFGG